MNNELQITVTDHDKKTLGNKNCGHQHERTRTNEREKIFSDLWREANRDETHHINYGHGTLQDLFFTDRKGLDSRFAKMIHHVTPIERYVVATVVQWLGSNCGMNFLEIALKKCGYKIVEDK